MSDVVIIYWQWGLVILTSLMFMIFTPTAKTKASFFDAVQDELKPSTMVLTGSLIISWIFAKSITNAANLGAAFGILGGVAYGAYYLSFIVAGFIIYNLRTKGNYNSLHHFLQSKFGKQAVNAFTILIVFRLFNEVWSNTMIIGNYFGESGSTDYYLAIVVFTGLTLAYTLKGGLSGSIFTDFIQMILFAILLLSIVYKLYTVENFNLTQITTSSTFSFEMGGNLLLAALLQSFSYPFHDPVMTDRGFLIDPIKTKKSFILSGIFGFIIIVAFSLMGVYAKITGLVGDASLMVAQSFGVVMLLIINLIMITSAASTLDSTFSSTAKLFVVDLKGVFGLMSWQKNTQAVYFGRLVMIGMALFGTIPILFGTEILSATTISGTMVIGLTPPFLLWKRKVPQGSFLLSVIMGLVFGFLLVFDWFPSAFIFTSGKYANLLWINFWGILFCFIIYLIPSWLERLEI